MPAFHSHDSLGARSVAEIAEYLLDIDDVDGAAKFTTGSVAGQGFLSGTAAFAHTGMMIGYIKPTAAAGGAVSSIIGISQMTGDLRLVDRRIKLTLDKFYVHSYPGLGQHTILCEFAGKNQVAGETEELRYALRFNAADKTSASISGVPIFMGVTVGRDGISFEGRTVNVSSSTDDVFLSTLDSPAFRTGLSLIATAQPALKPFASLATSAVKTVVERKRNKQVHSFNLGLDFSSTVSAARLCLGTYIVVQTDDSAWDWSKYEWNRDTMTLQERAAGQQTPPVNYMAFGVSEFVGDA